MKETLFEKIGGVEAVDAAVNIFYRKVLNDDELADFFGEVDIEEQLVKQKCFLTMVFGGPNRYSGLELREAHAPLVKKGLKEAHFLAVAEYLKETLEELNVPVNLIEEVMLIVDSTRSDILCL